MIAFKEVDLADFLLCVFFSEDFVIEEVACPLTLAKGNYRLCAVERVAPLEAVFRGLLRVVELADAQTNLDRSVQVEQVARRQEELPVLVLSNVEDF